MNVSNTIFTSFDEHLNVANETLNLEKSKIEVACNIINEAILNGNKIILFGNGGSAADAQHIAAEFTGRFVLERKALPAIALTTDTSALTAIGNDYGFDIIFKRQVEALANSGDVLIGITTSGNSKNVINAFFAGIEKNCKIICLSGKDGGKVKDLPVLNIIVPSTTTARIQEMHILIGHIFCTSVDLLFL